MAACTFQWAETINGQHYCVEQVIEGEYGTGNDCSISGQPQAPYVTCADLEDGRTVSQRYCQTSRGAAAGLDYQNSE